MTNPQHFLFALVDDFTHLAFACGVEPLRLANLINGSQLYRWSLASANGETATSSNGSVVQVQYQFDQLPACDRLFVLSGMDTPRQETSSLVAALRRERARGTQIGALCSGAYILAKAGLLDGTRAATHWDWHDSFREEFPSVTLVDSVFVADDKYLTASAGTATADMMLHLIEQDHGCDLAIAVADQMGYNAVRNATAAQRVSLQSRSGMRNKHLARAIQIMRDRIDDPISPQDLAQELGVTVRQIQRLFEKHLNSSPKKYFMDMRLQRARHLLLQTEASVTEVSLACGFENLGHFSRIYRAAYGVSPMKQRWRLS